MVYHLEIWVKKGWIIGLFCLYTTQTARRKANKQDKKSLLNITINITYHFLLKFSNICILSITFLYSRYLILEGLCQVGLYTLYMLNMTSRIRIVHDFVTLYLGHNSQTRSYYYYYYFYVLVIYEEGQKGKVIVIIKKPHDLKLHQVNMLHGFNLRLLFVIRSWSGL
ncbi:hypothetical protein ACJX0J_033215, partial [Zea mays]